jgi:histidine triad (HIT) family protein
VLHSAMACPFCEPLDTPMVIYNDPTVFAFLNNLPINPYHTLVIPRVHYTAFADLPADLVSHLFQVVQKVSSALRAVCAPHAIMHLQDDDPDGRGFNLVAHLKVHLIPRYVSDRVRIDWNHPPPPSRGERERQAGDLRDALAGSAGEASS